MNPPRRDPLVSRRLRWGPCLGLAFGALGLGLIALSSSATVGRRAWADPPLTPPQVAPSPYGAESPAEEPARAARGASVTPGGGAAGAGAPDSPAAPQEGEVRAPVRSSTRPGAGAGRGATGTRGTRPARRRRAEVPGARPVPPVVDALPNSLEEMLEQALLSSPEVLLAEAKLATARAELNQARLSVLQAVAGLYHELRSARTNADYRKREAARVRKLARQRPRRLWRRTTSGAPVRAKQLRDRHDRVEAALRVGRGRDGVGCGRRAPQRSSFGSSGDDRRARVDESRRVVSDAGETR